MDQPVYKLTWAEDDANNPFKNCSFQTLKPLTVYRIRSKLAMDWEPFGDEWLSNILLVEAIESDTHNQELENLRREYLNPVLFTHPLATFRLNTFMENFEAKAEWAGLPVKLSLNVEGDKPADGTLKRLPEVFAQQTQLYSTLNTYLLEHIRKHNGIRTKDGFFRGCRSALDRHGFDNDSESLQDEKRAQMGLCRRSKWSSSQCCDCSFVAVSFPGDRVRFQS